MTVEKAFPPRPGTAGAAAPTPVATKPLPPRAPAPAPTAPAVAAQHPAPPPPPQGDAQKAKKSDDMDADDVGGNSDPEEKDEMEKKAKKSEDLTSDDLEKSLAKLEALTQSTDTTSRKDALLSKATKGEELSKSERDELFGLLGGEAPKATVSESLVKGMQSNETIQKALDVSDFLTEQQGELVKSLSALGEVVQKSDARQHEFNLVLAKSIVDVGNLVKAVAQNIGAIAKQPARAPKSAGVPGGTALQKGFAGAPAADESQLTKGEVLGTLEAMLEKSMTSGQGGVAANGEDLLTAIAKYEQMNRMSPGLLEEVKAFRQNRTVTH